MDNKDIVKLLSRAKKNGISVFQKDDQLLISIAKGLPVDSFTLYEIKGNKTAIIDFLENNKSIFSLPQSVPEKTMPDVKEGIADIEIPLSFGQERLWVLDKLTGSTNYNIPVVFSMKGVVDKTILEYSIQQIVNRHEPLRTLLREERGTLYQHIQPENQWTIGYTEDISTEEELNMFLKNFIITPFDLSKDSVLRGILIKINASEFVIALVIHHISIDGWSVPVMVRELVELYRSKMLNQRPDLPLLEMRYADYAIWQRQHGKGADFEKKLDYWQHQLHNLLPLELPTDYSRPIVQSIQGRTIEFLINRQLSDELNQFSRENGVTLFMTLLAAFYVLLYRYTGQEDITVGTPVANRTMRATEGLIGLFVNTLVLRAAVNGDLDFTDLLLRVKEIALGAFEHQEVTFEKVVERLVTTRDVSRAPLFQIMFSLQNSRPIPSIDIEGVKFSLLPVENTFSKFDLTFDLAETKEGIALRLEYCTDLFKEDTIRKMAMHYMRILSAIISGGTARIDSIPILDVEEEQHLISILDNTKVSFPQNDTIVDAFEKQVLKTPNNIALIFEQTTLTYKELQEKTNRFGHYLRTKYSILPDDLLAIMTDPSEWIVIASIAVLKAGGAYIPIDPDYPPARRDFILADSKSVLLIDDAEIAKFKNEELKYSKESLSPVNKSNNLAYVIYTSGTTGKPKGCLIEHKNVIRLLFNQNFQFNFSSQDVWTMFHSFCFDFSVWEMYGALLNGGSLIIVPKLITRDPAAFFHLLEQKKVTVLNQTPSAFYNLSNQLSHMPVVDLALRYVIFGGEALNPTRLAVWREKFPQTKLINMYGITETTVHVTYKEITSVEIGSSTCNIGYPIPTLACYVLDTNQKLSPLGIPGELYVGGEGVARGYLNREELTNLRFVSNPFKKNDRLYRSGDKVRIMANGEMEYLGRIDEQVKIRGYRIELKEIEIILQKHQDVEKTAVTIKPGMDGTDEIVAYIVSKAKFPVKKIREYLAGHLPDFMLPAYFIQLNELPLTSNGKTDYKSLPIPLNADLTAGTAYEAPGTETEEKLVRIWKEILKIEFIGVNDNFFELGGNSITIIKMLSLVNEQLNLSIPVVTAFKHPNIYSLARYITSNISANNTSEESDDDIKESIDIMNLSIGYMASEIENSDE